MRILHLSDLHVTIDGRSLDELWLVAERAIRGQRFDFVVISGDLTQRADPSEYDRLHEFLERRIEPLVRVSDGESVKPRIIMVPGNHDVSWSAPIFEPLPFADVPPESVAPWLRAAQWQAETGNYRVHVGALGHPSLFRIIDSKYAQRFAAVDAFFKGYYGSALAAPHHRFDLLDPTGLGDWSAHVFPKERIAFLGFNSCHRNDRFWHGAYIHHRAVRAAKDHLDALPQIPGLVRVAVWHHGLESHRSRPDRLTLDNLGVLLSAEMTVGFHGHVHESVAEVHRFISDDLALVSTGTLGAASSDRPDAVGNQFSVVDLHWNRLRIDVFERSSHYGEYAKRSSRFMYFDRDRRAQDPSEPMRSWAGRVSRTVTLEEKDGIARVELEIDDLYLKDPIVLAQFDAQLCTIGDARAKVDGELLDVIEVLVGGRREFRFAGRPNLQRYRSLRWKYRLANALAVNRAELAILPDRAIAHPHIEATAQEAWSHVVQFDYDSLELSLRFVPKSDATGDYLIGSDGSYDVTPIVERRAGVWERVAAEESRAHLAATGGGFDLAWSSPMAGYRYGALYRVRPAGAHVLADDRASIDSVLAKCRGTRGGGELRGLLHHHLVSLLKVALHVEEETLFGEHLFGVGALWSTERRALRPAYGNFPPDAWATEFAAGRGVAGHAFRFERPAAWHRSAPGDLDVIKAPPTNRERDYNWILSLPLLTEPLGRAVGVISFAATANDTQTATELSDLALRSTSRTRDVIRVWGLVNIAFWHALERAGVEHPGLLPRGVHELAVRCEQAFLHTDP
ncbi:MAG TPA: metallophosphoesterase [Kofleriaceae bacterium]|jgi:hypothetical protein